MPLALAALILLVSLAVTGGLWQAARADAMKGLQADFEYRLRETVERIEARMGTYEQVLRGARGFLGGGTDIDHDRFRDYVDALRLDRNYPGIQGVAIAQLVAPAERERHVAAIRARGFEGYAIRPEGERDIVTSISHIEPFSGLNPRALGFDMYTEPVRRAAMARSRDTGESALSGKLTLVQEAQQPQPGFVMYMPVYRRGMPADTVGQRRAALVAWIGAPFRMNDLMAGLAVDRLADLHLCIFDGDAMTDTAKLYEHGRKSAEPLFRQTRQIRVAGRPWTIVVASGPAFEAGLDRETPRSIALTGVVVSALLGLLVWMLASGRRRALAVATAMTQELRDSESRWKYALEGAGDGVWDWNMGTGAIFYSRQWKRMLGYGDAELRADPAEWERLVHPQDKPRVDDILRRYMENGLGSHVVEHRLLCKDGSWKWILSRGMVVSRDASGKPLRLIGTHADISARKDAEAREAERLRQLEDTRNALHHAQKLEAVGKLTGGVAHDFNNALQIIGGNLELLERRLAPDTPLQALLKGAMKAVDRGAKLSSQLLAFARRQPLQPRVVDIGRMTRNMDELLRRALGESVEVHTVIAPGAQTTLVDPYQLENVILNLALNSRDAMDGSGSLTIEIGDERLGGGADPDLPAGRYVTVAVADTGAGMTPEVMEHAFEPFFTTKPEGQGTGLGLSMAYGFVKQSGGHIRIFSEVGHGTMVKIYLPASDDPESDAALEVAQTVIGGSETILVVEDDPGVRGVVVANLADLGYQVLQAADAKAALDILQGDTRIDLLFTDVVMPGPIQSPELARRAQALLPGIAVLFTSGYTSDVFTRDGHLSPGVQLLGKPYRREQLAIRVRSLLFHKHGEPAPAPESDVHAAEDDRPAPAGRRILVVEDNDDMRMVVCEMLVMLGHAPQAVGSAEEALERLARGGVDILLTDVGLPGMNGLELARTAAATHRAMKIIIASGYGDSIARPDGFDSVTLAKPYNLNALQQALLDETAPAASWQPQQL